MTKQEVIKQFALFYPNYKQEAKKDYCKMQFAWACYVDSLNKDGQLTDKQVSNWLTPFKE